MPETTAATVDPTVIETYLNTIFAHVDWSEGGIVSLLGIGEKNTPQEGKFRDRKFLLPGQGDLSLAVGHAKRWGEHSIATFIVPAVIHSAAQLAGDVTLDKIKAFTAIMVDLDSGDIEAKLAHLERALGVASMVVMSGGKTETGQQKRHVYWRLTEPSDQIDRIAAARKLLAAKVGGDQSFGRATQVCRLPGSLHGKGGVISPVTIERISALDYDADELIEAIETMALMAGVGPPAQSNLPALVGGLMDFSGGAGREMDRMSAVLTSEIHEGGEGERNRWTEFSAAAGHHIAMAARGEYDLDEAYRLVCGWVLVNMKPPKDEPWIRTEFAALVNQHRKNHPDPPTIAPEIKIESGDELLSWAVHRRVSPTPPARRILVEGLVYSAKRHMLVAEGGAGKTFLCMDLALKLAAAGEGRELHWLGRRVLPEAEGGTVILMTGEDDQEELDIRWHAVDPAGLLIAAAGDRLIALPMDNLGGAFPLAAQHPHTREVGPSLKWANLFRAIRDVVARGGRISAVIIDTLNSTLHGEENSAQVIGEYVRAVAPVCGELGAALVVTHHVRKAGQEPIKTLEDMREAIRGSTALPNAMRLVIGVWAAHNYERKMRQMGMAPERARLFYGGVIKANMPDALREQLTLLRSKEGLLEDITSRDVSSRGPNPELVAWLEWAVKRAADLRAPFSQTGGNCLHARRSQLPPMFHQLSRDSDFKPLTQWMLEQGILSLKAVANAGNTHTYLDVPECKDITRTIIKGAALDLDWKNHYYDHGWDEIRPMER